MTDEHPPSIRSPWQAEPDYEGLLRQALALAALCSSMETQASHLRSECARLEKDLQLTDRAAMDAERDTNQRLTDALEAAEQRIAELTRQCVDWTGKALSMGGEAVQEERSAREQLESDLEEAGERIENLEQRNRDLDEELHVLPDQRRGWIPTADSLPEDRGVPYQVIAAAAKELGGNYRGMAARGFYQDWVVRRWPQNFLAWMDAPEHVSMPGMPKETEA